MKSTCLKVMDQKAATSIQFLVLVTGFVILGKAPHFSENEIVGPGQSE